MMKRRLPSSGRHDVGVRGGEECRHHEETEEGNTQRIVCVLFSHKHNKMTSLGSLRVAQKNVLRLVHLRSQIRAASLIGVVLQKDGAVRLLNALRVRVHSTRNKSNSTSTSHQESKQPLSLSFPFQNHPGSSSQRHRSGHPFHRSCSCSSPLSTP